MHLLLACQPRITYWLPVNWLLLTLGSLWRGSCWALAKLRERIIRLKSLFIIFLSLRLFALQKSTSLVRGRPVCWQSQQTVRVRETLASQGAELAKKGVYTDVNDRILHYTIAYVKKSDFKGEIFVSALLKCSAIQSSYCLRFCLASFENFHL